MENKKLMSRIYKNSSTTQQPPKNHIQTDLKMNKTLEYTFLQRIYATGQKSQKKMLNTTTIHKNESQNSPG